MQMVLEATQKELTIEEQEHIYEVNDIFWAIIKMEAQNLQFDSYCLYLEKNRDPKEKFYQPRRKIFRKHGIVQAYQRILDDDKLKLLGISLPPSTGKTTLEKYFHSALCGWFPGDGNLFYSHSGDITRMYYDGVYDIVTNGTEYTWGEIFPGLHVTNTNAKLEQFNVGSYKPFPNVQAQPMYSKVLTPNGFVYMSDVYVGMEVIAEGVETEPQLDFLRNIGCKLVQGYYYAKPMAADEFMEKLMSD